MKIVIVGGTGTIGSAVSAEIAKRHEVIIAGHANGDLQVDIENPASIENMYKKISNIDAIIATAGHVSFAPLSEMTHEKFNVGIQNKLMGQINLVLIGMHYLNKGGSFTLTSGILSEHPIKQGSNATMVNGALEHFVKAAAAELCNDMRINVVSPTVISESLEKFGDYFLGFEAVPAKRVALAYVRSLEGIQTGEVISVFN